MVRHHQRIDQSGGGVRDIVGQSIGKSSRPHELFSIGAVADESDVVGAVDVAAQVFEPGFAHVAFATIEVGPEDDTLAHLEVTCAGIGDNAAEFVSHPELARVVWVPAFAGHPHMNIGAANAGSRHLDADVSRTQFGNGDFLDFDLFRAGQDGGLHGT